MARATEGSLLICKQCLLFTFATDLFPCRNKGYLLPYKNGQQKLAEFFLPFLQSIDLTCVLHFLQIVLLIPRLPLNCATASSADCCFLLLNFKKTITRIKNTGEQPGTFFHLYGLHVAEENEERHRLLLLQNIDYLCYNNKSVHNIKDTKQK